LSFNWIYVNILDSRVLCMFHVSSTYYVGIEAIVLTGVRRMAGLAIRVYVDRADPPDGTGLAAVAAYGSASLVGNVIAGTAALGVVRGGQ
jgi:hypothetical protein